MAGLNVRAPFIPSGGISGYAATADPTYAPDTHSQVGTAGVALPTGNPAIDTATLQNAANAVPAGGGLVQLQAGIYVINATVTQAVAFTTFAGAGGQGINLGGGATTIRTTSAIRMFDSGGLDGMQFRDVTIDGTGVATNLWHAYVTGNIGQHFRTNHVRFINGAPGSTLVDTFGGVNWSIADCRFYDTDFVTGGLGITLGDYDNQFFGCTFAILDTAGVKFRTGRAGGGGDFFGCIWSGNKVDVLLNVIVGPLSFFGCWFENSSQSTVALGAALGQAGNMAFYNCNIQSNGPVFDLTTAGLGTIEMWGGQLNPSAPVALKIPTNCTVFAHSIMNAELYTFTGGGFFIRENSPATQLYPGRELFSGHFAVATPGYGLRVAEGANAKQGLTAAMVAGTVTVANTSVTANSRINYWRATPGGALGHISYSKIAGTSFTLTSSSNTETSTFEYEIFEPA